ncbi:type 2 lanthipeptide synthetase LanM family protein [Lysobacter sp. 1R34A]|uniref:type 2 lanthipeptide synthetase LanM family protein n=1 Tax=Lysobacter sp. 1R34A TaxID=3445786 RepID=UPI003EEBCAB0
MSSLDFDRYYIAAICRAEAEALRGEVAACVAASRLPPGFHAPIADGASEYLMQRLCWMFQKVFVFELNRYAAAAPKRDDAPTAPTAVGDPVFVAFVQAIAGGDAARELRQRYGFLFQRAQWFCAGFIEFLGEHLLHLGDDLPALADFDLRAGDAPQRVEFGQGDPHRGARATVRYRFERTDLYYKPRGLGLDLLFAGLQRLIDPDMAVLASIERGDYGWQLGIRGGGAQGRAAAERFYRSLGVCTAVAHALCGSDLHFENIVTDAQGRPFFVDVEALFTNTARIDRQPPSSVPLLDAERELDRRLGESALSVGVVSLRRTREGVFSGAAQGDKVAAPVSREVAVDARTASMRLSRVQEAIQIDSPVPRVDGEPAAFAAHFDGFADGYRQAAAALTAHIDEVEALLRDNAALRSRQILRHTYLYGLFLAETTHPALVDPAKTDALLLKLRREEASKPFLRHLYASEREQMLQFDIPYFEAQLDGRDLLSPCGKVEGFFERSALEQVRERLARFADPRWIARQLSYVATALGCETGPELGQGDIADAAAALLAEQAVPGEGDGSVLWTYSPPVGTPGGEFAIMPMGPDLYTGLAGLLLFLSRRCAHGASADDHALNERLIATGRRILVERSPMLGSGAYSGMEGLILSLSEAAGDRGDRELASLALETFLAREPQWDPARHDIIDGAAGIALVALALRRQQQDPRLVDVARRLATRLTEAARDTADGPEWWLHGVDRCVTGFAHGGSGIAFALIHLARALGDANLHELALRALRREDRLFNSEIGLWPDTRMDEPQYSLGWCNGAAGFLLARAEVWNDLEAWQREHVRTAFARSVEWFGRLEDDSLCHGTAGVRLALAAVAGKLGLASDVSQSELAPSKNHCRGGWSHDSGNLGLMVGLTGIGVALLQGNTRNGRYAVRICPLTLT